MRTVLSSTLQADESPTDLDTWPSEQLRAYYGAITGTTLAPSMTQEDLMYATIVAITDFSVEQLNFITGTADQLTLLEPADLFRVFDKYGIAFEGLHLQSPTPPAHGSLNSWLATSLRLPHLQSIAEQIQAFESEYDLDPATQPLDHIEGPTKVSELMGYDAVMGIISTHVFGTGEYPIRVYRPTPTVAATVIRDCLTDNKFIGGIPVMKLILKSINPTVQPSTGNNLNNRAKIRQYAQQLHDHYSPIYYIKNRTKSQIINMTPFDRAVMLLLGPAAIMVPRRAGQPDILEQPRLNQLPFPTLSPIVNYYYLWVSLGCQSPQQMTTDAAWTLFTSFSTIMLQLVPAQYFFERRLSDPLERLWTCSFDSFVKQSFIAVDGTAFYRDIDSPRALEYYYKARFVFSVRHLAAAIDSVDELQTMFKVFVGGKFHWSTMQPTGIGMYREVISVHGQFNEEYHQRSENPIFLHPVHPFLTPTELIQGRDSVYSNPETPPDPELPYMTLIASRRDIPTTPEDKLPSELEFNNHYGDKGHEMYYLEYKAPDGGSTSSSQQAVINDTFTLPLGDFRFPPSDLQGPPASLTQQPTPPRNRTVRFPNQGLSYTEPPPSGDEEDGNQDQASDTDDDEDEPPADARRDPTSSTRRNRRPADNSQNPPSTSSRPPAQSQANNSRSHQRRGPQPSTTTAGAFAAAAPQSTPANAPGPFAAVASTVDTLLKAFFDNVDSLDRLLPNPASPDARGLHNMITYIPADDVRVNNLLVVFHPLRESTWNDPDYTPPPGSSATFSIQYVIDHMAMGVYHVSRVSHNEVRLLMVWVLTTEAVDLRPQTEFNRSMLDAKMLPILSNVGMSHLQSLLGTNHGNFQPGMHPDDPNPVKWAVQLQPPKRNRPPADTQQQSNRGSKTSKRNGTNNPSTYTSDTDSEGPGYAPPTTGRPHATIYTDSRGRHHHQPPPARRGPTDYNTTDDERTAYTPHQPGVQQQRRNQQSSIPSAFQTPNNAYPSNAQSDIDDFSDDEEWSYPNAAADAWSRYPTNHPSHGPTNNTSSSRPPNDYPPQPPNGPYYHPTGIPPPNGQYQQYQYPHFLPQTSRSEKELVDRSTGEVHRYQTNTKETATYHASSVLRRTIKDFASLDPAAGMSTTSQQPFTYLQFLRVNNGLDGTVTEAHQAALGKLPLMKLLQAIPEPTTTANNWLNQQFLHPRLSTPTDITWVMFLPIYMLKGVFLHKGLRHDPTHPFPAVIAFIQNIGLFLTFTHGAPLPVTIPESLIARFQFPNEDDLGSYPEMFHLDQLQMQLQQLSIRVSTGDLSKASHTKVMRNRLRVLQQYSPNGSGFLMWQANPPTKQPLHLNKPPANPPNGAPAGGKAGKNRNQPPKGQKPQAPPAKLPAAPPGANPAQLPGRRANNPPQPAAPQNPAVAPNPAAPRMAGPTYCTRAFRTYLGDATIPPCPGCHRTHPDNLPAGTTLSRANILTPLFNRIYAANPVTLQQILTLLATAPDPRGILSP